MIAQLRKESRILRDGAWNLCTLFDVNFVPKGMSPEGLQRGFVAQHGLLALVELRERTPVGEAGSPEVEIALTWLADHGDDASIVDASGEPDEVASLLLRLARDPDLTEGRIVPR